MTEPAKPKVIWELNNRRVVRRQDGTLAFESTWRLDGMGMPIWYEVHGTEIKNDFTAFWIEVGKKFAGN